jgi:predicted enzyme related to lactoylglutathione lyase
MYQVTPDIPDRRRATKQKEVRPAGPTASKRVSSPPVGTIPAASDITDKPNHNSKPRCRSDRRLRHTAGMAGHDGESRVFRRAGISYMRIPAKDPQASAAFYHDVFGWTVDAARPDPSFEDGSGHVIGHFIADAAVSGEAGVGPYVYVESVDDALERVSAGGGVPVETPYAEAICGGDLPRSSGQHDRRLTTRIKRLNARGYCLRLRLT